MSSVFFTIVNFPIAIVAGALNAFGAQVSLTVMTGTERISWGFAKLIGAMTFTLIENKTSYE